ncbi:ABC transporter permease [Micromonospora sp. FIMYZ51]|uniref:ABC transporter permease n=1 Tax=Micromonospora sp. FIMYZ51 TaxID=3051832 RepID=UPI00311FC0A4
MSRSPTRDRYAGNVVWATFVRSWTMNRRAYPWTYFTSTVLAGALTISLAYLAFHAVGGSAVNAEFAQRAGSADYVGYVAVGALAYAFMVRMLLWTAKALITEEREGTIAALAVAPAHRLPYLMGFSLFAVASTGLEVAALSGFALLLGVQLPVPSLLNLALVLLILTIAVFSLSLVVSAVMLYAGEAHITQNTVFLLLGLICGFTFPRSYLPDLLRWLAELVPITAALDVARPLLNGAIDAAELTPRLAVALGVSVIYLIAGFWLLPRAESRAIERSF